MSLTYEELFQLATGGHRPYPYQRRLAEVGPLAGTLKVPTGAGKTAAVVLGWYFRRFLHSDLAVRASTPRRLVICLPMRSLVEQSAGVAAEWMQRLGSKVPVHRMLGGEIAPEWTAGRPGDAAPERELILIGTQDQLLSRALNRGYAMSRYQWPVHFGLLHSDVLWVFDEVQLMGDALATSTQLEALRRQLGVFGPARTLWMSATMERDWLATVDLAPSLDGLSHAEMGEADLRKDALATRLHAPKPITGPVARLEAGAASRRSYLEAMAAAVMAAHRKGSLTLVVLNRVDRAQALFDLLVSCLHGSDAELRLLHSRFRAHERRSWRDDIFEAPLPPAGRILVSTQVVEAGVDLSARCLLTELAPWPSLVQRFGRCNRDGAFGMGEASVRWFDLDEGDDASPYLATDLAAARSVLAGMDDACPMSLPTVPMPYTPKHVLRRRDLVQLFDTSSDLTGFDIDVGRFVRDTEESGVFAFWRPVSDGGPPASAPDPQRDELCSVPQSGLVKLLGKQGRVYQRDLVDGGWTARAAARIRPGATVWIPSHLGGYDPQRGFIPEAAAKPVPAIDLPAPTVVDESHEGDPSSFLGYWASLAAHSHDVAQQMQGLVDKLHGFELPAADLLKAARWHDRGKAHPVFQETLRRDRETAPAQSYLLAKGAGHGRHARRGFRHELASALALLAAEESDLAAYLSASHHGKVRLSIRALPSETHPEGGGAARFARGIWDGDLLPETDLGGGVTAPALTLDLEVMELGRGLAGPSWSSRALDLVRRWGPFRLGYLEALMRIADGRASAQPTPEPSLEMVNTPNGPPTTSRSTHA